VDLKKFFLYKLNKVENKTNQIFNLINRDISSSIFPSLSYKFFNNLVKNKIINVYIIKYKKKNSVIITVVTKKNLLKLKYKIFLFYIFNPHKFIYNISKIFSSLSRNSNVRFDDSYLYLLHLIIYKKNFLNISIKKKDKIITFFLKNILIFFKAKNFFACYEKKNLSAFKYYFRNNFIVFSENKNSVFIKKRFIK
jgi:hypothetical protein